MFNYYYYHYFPRKHINARFVVLTFSGQTQFLREKNFKQTIPQVKVKDGEEITHETATIALRRAAHHFSALQASDGHWPSENAGPLYFLPPFVSVVVMLITFIF